MNSIEQLIKKYVEQYEQKYSDYSIHSKCLEDMGEIDLVGITEKEVEGIIEPFL